MWIVRVRAEFNPTQPHQPHPPGYPKQCGDYFRRVAPEIPAAIDRPKSRLQAGSSAQIACCKGCKAL